MVTINPNKNKPGECTYSEVNAVLKRFKKPNDKITAIRNEKDEAKKEAMKAELPVVVFQGKFSHRKNSALLKPSGFMILDFDCKTEDESRAVFEKIKDDEYMYSIFRSVRGIGFKALVRIPAVRDDSEYKAYFYSIKERYPELDESGKDVARACFITYDPDMIINGQSKVWDQKKEQQIELPPATGTDYRKLNTAANIIRASVEGQRHEKIRNAAILAGGWVGSGKVDRSEAERILLDEANRKNPDDTRTNGQTVRDGIDHGISKPLTEEEEKSEMDEERIMRDFGKVYYTIEDVWDTIDEKYQKGISGGYTCGLPVVDDLYKMYPGYTTYLYGAAFSGKSQLWHHYLYYLSRRYGLKHALFSPETGDREDVFAELIEIHAQDNFYDTGYGKMTPEKLEHAKKFIGEHFIIIDPEENDLDFMGMCGICEMIERYYNTKIDTMTIDPWNDLTHDMEGDNYRDDVYLQKELKRVRIKARANDWHICIVTHARDQALAKGDGSNYYPPATFREVAGGQAWNRRGFQMVSAWRPPKDLKEYKGVILDGSEVFWFQQKFKPKYAGKNGMAVLKYDIRDKRYYQDGTWKIYPNLELSSEITTVREDEKEAPF